ncbi:GST-like protein [Croceicoccus estronivorus]|uniref:MAPEG family protein n=1 Tax=Croceicoccus estronivorus TaxID=1172626 RepID=UPI0008318FA0|nr:MAPEG family protein [Croceicoccus estronivorus]OCC22721.1 GST-like protein [Croceicoccus estronivorus]
MILATTLTAAAAAALINMWLMFRCGSVRANAKIIHGDGGNPLMLKRMRAHANFIESTPLVLILAGAIEIAGKGGIWLPLVVGAFLLARVGHAIGMDGDTANPLRAAGAAITFAVLLGLAVVAVLIALGKF